jgi:hypothetical protein
MIDIIEDEELHNLYSSLNILKMIASRTMRWKGHVARIGGKMGVHRVFVGKSAGKTQLRRPGLRWEVNIKIDLRETGWGSVLDLYGSGQGPVAASCEHRMSLRSS